MQKLHTELGLSLRFALLVAFMETERTWAEAVNTAGYQGFFLLWQQNRRASLPLAPGHPPPLLTGTSPPAPRKAESKGQGTLGEGGIFKFIPPSPCKGNHRGWVTSHSTKPHYWCERQKKKKKEKSSQNKPYGISLQQCSVGRSVPALL